MGDGGEAERDKAVEASVSMTLPPFQSSGTATVEWLWHTASLTFGAVLYTAIITIGGVLVASLHWPWRVAYAFVCLLLLVLGLTLLKPWVIRRSKRVLGKVRP